MATIFSNLFSINGVVSTDKSVMQNLNTLCTASGCWLTFDVNTGLWSVIINSVGSSIKSFTDANIIGAINVSGSGINELYNKVSIEFPHVDLRDQTDYIDMRIPDEQLYPQEIENILNIKLDCINNPLQAQQIASQELKQSRVDKIIEFRTDFSSLGLKAGDLIDITSSVYGYTNKVFRIIRMTEEDGDDGTLYVSITALEYDPAVYDNSGLVREERQKKTGIIPKSQNTALTSLDNGANMNSITDGLLDPANLALLLGLMNALTRGGALGSGVGLTPTVNTFISGIIQASQPDGLPHEINLGYSLTLPYTGYYKTTYSINWGGSGSPGYEGVQKNSFLVVKSGGITINNVSLSLTGDNNVQLYEDHVLDSIWYGTQGQVVNFYFEYATDWGALYGGLIPVPGAPNYDPTSTAIFLVNGETKYIGRQ